MPYSWDEIKTVIERIENEKEMDKLEILEHEEGFMRIQPSLTEKTKSYLEFLGEFSVGVIVGIITIIFNFLLLVWLLHLEF